MLVLNSIQKLLLNLKPPKKALIPYFAINGNITHETYDIDKKKDIQSEIALAKTPKKIITTSNSH
jgi:hypothetical protein